MIGTKIGNHTPWKTPIIGHNVTYQIEVRLICLFLLRFSINSFSGKGPLGGFHLLTIYEKSVTFQQIKLF